VALRDFKATNIYKTALFMFMGFRVEKECCAPETVVFRVHGQRIPETAPVGDEFTACNEFALKTTTRDDREIRAPETAGSEFMTSKTPKRSLQQVMNVKCA
jgi:hypothetical protein